MRLSFDFDFDDDPRDELQALAERHGGRYDGGGTYVGPISHLLPEDPHPESAP